MAPSVGVGVFAQDDLRRETMVLWEFSATNACWKTRPSTNGLDGRSRRSGILPIDESELPVGMSARVDHLACQRRIDELGA